MRSLTLMFGFSIGVKGRAGVVGIQGTSHTLTSYDECTLCLISNNNNFLANEIVAHTYDGLFTEIACKKAFFLILTVVLKIYYILFMISIYLICKNSK